MMDDTLMLRQQFAVSRSRLFSLLSTPEYMEQWLSPSEEVKLRVLNHNFSEGGEYQLQYTHADGELAIVGGDFVKIDSPDIISFTWEWQEPAEHAGICTMVTWRITDGDNGSGSELTLIQEKIPSKDFYERHKQGWLGSIDRLEKLVDKK